MSTILSLIKVSPDYIIWYLSMLVWALVAVRQRESRFFLFFILLAFEDPVAFIVCEHFGFTAIDAYIYFDLLRFLSLLKKDEIIENRYILGIGLGFILFMHFVTKGTMNNILVNSFIHFAIFLKLLQIFVKEVSLSKILNIFLLLLVFYQLNTVTKLINTFTVFSDSFYYFYLSSAFQILIGIFFIFFREDNRKLIYRLQ